MENYPKGYYDHDLPLVFLSGLGNHSHLTQDMTLSSKQGIGAKVSLTSQECGGGQVRELLEQFSHRDGTNSSWNVASLPRPPGSMKFRIKAIGRTFSLPSRKAAPIPQSPSSEGFDSYMAIQSRNAELHSPLSPLSPGSPIFPDGVFTPLWMTKHQSQVPSLFLAFFQISSPGSSSDDDIIKNDISACRSALGRSGFKSRFAAVLISDTSIVQAPELEERIASIRRASSLDLKTGLFFMPPMSSSAEVAAFVQSLLNTLQPLCVEYYRELTKHARRKKSRGAPSPSIGAVNIGSQALSSSGWNTRYEYKQGIFAEFRQEMDVAERHYAAAMEEMFNAEGILEMTHTWSPRWDEARLLCDCVALRCLRSLLWTDSTMRAAQFWRAYRSRMRDLIDRRGKGSQTYSWDAWETRWAEVMAQLIQRASLTIFKAHGSENESILFQPYDPSDKTYAVTDRISPFSFLHHAGYWYNLSVQAARRRRLRAQEIPEEHRVPPGRSPASAVARRTASYDSYLVPDPHEENPLDNNDGHDHSAEVNKHVKKAIECFKEAGQDRQSDMIKLNLVRELVDNDRYEEALSVVIPLWNTTKWRTERWYDLMLDLLQLLSKCALQQKHAEALLGATYELLSMPPADGDQSLIDLSRCISKLDHNFGPVVLKYHNADRISPIDVDIAFLSQEICVGEQLDCQIILVSHARAGSNFITPCSFSVEIGTNTIITFQHSASNDTGERVPEVFDLGKAIQVGESSTQIQTDLRMEPGQRRILNLQLTFRVPELVRVTKLAFTIATEQFRIEHSFTDEERFSSRFSFALRDDQVQSRPLAHQDTSAVTVLPKPPKAKLEIKSLRKQYHTSEITKLEIEVHNAETELIQGSIEAAVLDEGLPMPELIWSDIDESGDGSARGVRAMATIQGVPPGGLQRLTLLLRAPLDPATASISVNLDYSLRSNPETVLKKSLIFDVQFLALFETKYNFGPLLHSPPWPTYFDPLAVGSEEHFDGIPQLWLLACNARSLAMSDVVVHSTNLIVDRIAAGDAKVDAQSVDDKKRTVKSGETTSLQVRLCTTKKSLDDRRATGIDCTLVVNWSHHEDDEPMSLMLRVPHLTMPTSEPRVLCTLSEKSLPKSDVVVHYHIENPSSHFLTFALTMEASEEFAFSGPKYRNLSLAPLSRHRIEYRVSVYDRTAMSGLDSELWIWPTLRVVDSFYNKQLRVSPGGPGVKIGEKGDIGVLVPYQAEV